MQTKTFAAFAGIRNTLSTERLERASTQAGNRDIRTELEAATNVDIDDSGRISRRAGQQVVVPAAAHSLWSDDDVCLFVQSGSMYQLDKAYTKKLLISGLGDTEVHYLAVNGIVYWTNSVVTGIVANGVASAWGVAAPISQPSASIVAGNMTAATYLYAATYTRADGQESGTGMSVRIDLKDGAGLRFAWPVPTNRDIVGVNIYLSEPNSETMFLAVSAPVGAGNVTFNGGALSTPLNTQWLDAPPPGQELSFHRGRIYIAQGEFLFASSPLGYSYVDMRDYLALDGTRIRFVIGVDHGLFVGTDKTVYFLKGDRFDQMEVDAAVEAHGVAGSAILVDGFVATGDDKLSGLTCAMFATGSGICLGTPDGATVNLTYDRFQTTMPRSGAAVLRTSQTQTQYLLTMRD